VIFQKFSLSIYSVFKLERVEPLLGNNLETNNETTFADRQQIFNKQIYAAVAGFRGDDWSTSMNGVICAVRAEML
jgi:hypothetical protein